MAKIVDVSLPMGKLIEVHTILDKLGNFKSDKLPISFFYQTAKILEKTKREYEFFEKQRKELVEQYAERDEKGEIKLLDNENVRIEPDKQTEFFNKFNELMEMIIGISEVKAIKILNNYNLPLTANELMMIMDFVEMEGED